MSKSEEEKWKIKENLWKWMKQSGQEEEEEDCKC